MIICYYYLQEILEGVTDIDLVINLKLREDVLLAKCLGRRICSECGGNFNIACIDIKGEDGKPGIYMPPLDPPPHCVSKLITRSDDIEEVVKERLRVYNEMVFRYSHISYTWNETPIEHFRHHITLLLTSELTCFVRVGLWKNSTADAGNCWNSIFPEEFQNHGQSCFKLWIWKTMINGLRRRELLKALFYNK